ncbi:MAG: hypothetical protein CMO55_11110 [Verrucomicrobiales bacterium]|nr:hypothetical protein [Verrucomicrobiales bacterium]
MKRTITLFGIATPVLIFAAYLTLTAGTWFLIPDVITRIEPGMTYEESIGQFPEEWRIDNADINLLAGGHKKLPDWHTNIVELVSGSKAPMIIHNREKMIGLRFWRCTVITRNDTVEEILFQHTDWHVKAWAGLSRACGEFTN